MDVGRREHARLRGDVFFVEGYLAVPDDERIDFKVKGCVLGGVFRCQRIQGKLKVEVGIGLLLIECSLQSEELGRGDDDAPLREREQIDFCRHAGRTEHGQVLLVVNLHVVHDDAVQKTEVHPAYAHVSAKFCANGFRYFFTKETLCCWQLQQHDKCDIQTHQSP